MLSLKLSHWIQFRRPVPDPVTNMMVLDHAHHPDQSYLDDTIPLHQFCGPVHLIPVFGELADNCLNAYNSVHFSLEFFSE